MRFSIEQILRGLILTGLAGLLLPLSAQEVTGAGASFPAPAYSRWAAEYYKASGIRVNYQSIGSSGGIKQIESRTVDFGATDAPLRDEDLAARGLVQFPTLIGGVVPVVNIPGIPQGALRLSGAVLGDIYLGRITQWSDPAIKALNPGVELPEATITPVRRADGSGTTFLFTNYLSRSHPQWRDKVGEGTVVNWPVGTGGKGNEGVALYVSRLPNSIGYLEYAYVKQNRLNYVQLQNAAGQFVRPSSATFAAAAANASWDKTLTQILTNQPGADAWPITGATFVLMQAKGANPAITQETIKFFRWAYAHGGRYATDLDFLTMPPNVIQRIEAIWSTVPGHPAM